MMLRASLARMTGQDWQAADAIARAVLTEHAGVAKMSAFRAAGLSTRQVAAICARGLLERPRNAWYVDPGISWQAKSAVRAGGVLGCVSAVDSFGLPVPPVDGRLVHVVVPLDSARLRHHRDMHHSVVPDEDREARVHWATAGRDHLGWRTPLLDALLLLVDCVPEEWFVAAPDAALHQPWEGDPLMSAGEWQQFCGPMPRRKRHLLGLVDPLSGSCLETLLRLGLLRRGIGPVALQFSPDGVRFVDLLVGDLLIVEAEGAAFHDAEQDAVRDARFRALGSTVLRFSYDRIVHDLEAVLDEIQDALAVLDPAF